MFSFNPDEKKFRKLKDKEIIVVFISAGGFASDTNLMHNIKPVAVQYHLESDQFLAIENSMPVIPFINTYIYPGWNIFNLSSDNYRNNFINAIKANIQTRLN